MSKGCDSICNMSIFGLRLCMFKCMILMPLLIRSTYESVDIIDESDELDDCSELVVEFGPGLG